MIKYIIFSCKYCNLSKEKGRLNVFNWFLLVAERETYAKKQKKKNRKVYLKSLLKTCFCFSVSICCSEIICVGCTHSDRSWYVTVSFSHWLCVFDCKLILLLSSNWRWRPELDWGMWRYCQQLEMFSDHLRTDRKTAVRYRL